MNTNYKNTHIFCCTNYGYLKYTRNFIEYYKKLNTQWKLHVYCMDKKSYEFLKDIHEIIAHFIPVSYISDEELYEWGQSQYKQICYYRYKIIYPLFKIKKLKYVIHFDTDIALLKDPVDFMINYMDNHKNNCEIAGQCDEKSLTCSNHLKCPNICGGCFILRNTESTLLLTKESSYINLIEHYHSDQGYFNHKLTMKHSFPTDLFVHTPKESLLHKDTFLYHFNWLIGDIKESIMKEKNYWLLTN